MLSEHIKSQIYANFAFTPTFGQKKVVESLSDFLTDTDYHRIFILDGYAGTGKTALMAAVVSALRNMKIRSVLLAPTGRAAKVMGQYAGQKAYTIHKRIYRQKSPADVESRFTLDFNKEKDALFIVDEASMLANYAPGGSLFGSGDLLDDLIRYVRAGRRCRLIIVGDNAQLPPVGLQRSPALDPEHLRVYGEVTYELLDDVVRQDVHSGILFNATLVRCML
jgi:exodeoxyribonuclease-5